MGGELKGGSLEHQSGGNPSKYVRVGLDAAQWRCVKEEEEVIRIGGKK